MKKTKSSLVDFITYKLTKKNSLAIYGGLTQEGSLPPELEEWDSNDPNDPNDPSWGGPGSGTASGTTSATLMNPGGIKP
ncbi:MAG: hypothetical protein V4670_10810 [Bacteroidota bacterium]